MKNLTFILVLVASLSFNTSTYAGDNPSSTLKAEKVCSPLIDIFNTDNVESALGITGGEKITFYEVVLALPEADANKAGNFGIYKYDTEYNKDFKNIMSEVKKHATSGSILFIGEIKTVSGVKISDAHFFLRSIPK